MPIGEFLENPYIQLGMNMLGNMNYSDRPQTLAGGIGQAFQQTVQQARQRKILEMEQQRHEFESKTQDLQLKKYEQALKQEQRRAKLGEMLATSDLSPAAYQRIGAIAMAQGDTEFGLQLWKAAEGDELPAEVRSAQWAAKNPDDPAVKIWTENQRAPKTQVNIGGSKYGTISQDHKLVGEGTPEEQIVPIKGAPEQSAIVAKKAELDRAFGKATSLLNDYESVINETGPEYFGSFVGGEDSVKARSRYTNLLLAFKDLAEMGALQGPDLEVLQGSLTDPTTAPAWKIGKGGLLEQVKGIREYIENARRAAGLGGGASGSWGGGTPSEALRKQAEAQGLILE